MGSRQWGSVKRVNGARPSGEDPLNQTPGDVLVGVEGLDGAVLRFAAFRGGVHAVTQLHDGTRLHRSTDGGRTFQPLDLGDAGDPQSLAPAADSLLLLAGGALYQSDDGARFMLRVPPIDALAHRPSTLASAPIAIHAGRVFAASPSTGELFVADEAR